VEIQKVPVNLFPLLHLFSCKARLLFVLGDALKFEIYCLELLSFLVEQFALLCSLALALAFQNISDMLGYAMQIQ
jgi:hypothetical protein